MTGFSLDVLDNKIIAQLEENAWQSNREIAAKLKTSHSTVHRRIRHLIKNDVVKIIAVPNPRKVGPSYWAELGVRVIPGNGATVAGKIAAMPGVYFVALTFGRYDIMISARFDSLDKLSEFSIKDIGRIDGVVSTETFIIADVKKYYSFMW